MKEIKHTSFMHIRMVYTGAGNVVYDVFKLLGNFVFPFAFSLEGQCFQIDGFALSSVDYDSVSGVMNYNSSYIIADINLFRSKLLELKEREYYPKDGKFWDEVFDEIDSIQKKKSGEKSISLQN
jgi:hypothetical protein